MILIPSSLNITSLFNDCKVQDTVTQTPAKQQRNDDKSCFSRQVGKASPYARGTLEAKVREAKCNGNEIVVYGSNTSDEPIATIHRVDDTDKTFKIVFSNQNTEPLTAKIVKQQQGILLKVELQDDASDETNTYTIYKEVSHPYHSFPRKYCISVDGKTVASTREQTLANDSYQLTVHRDTCTANVKLVTCLVAIADEYFN